MISQKDDTQPAEIAGSSRVVAGKAAGSFLQLFVYPLQANNTNKPRVSRVGFYRQTDCEI